MENEIKVKLIETRIESIIDQKLILLKEVQAKSGLEKAKAMDKFLDLNDEEDALNFELLTIQAEIYSKEED